MNFPGIRGGLLLLSLFACALAPAEQAPDPGLLPARNAVKPIFEKNCKSCHDWSKGTPYFGADGLPARSEDNISKIVYATQYLKDLARPMPPGGKLSPDALEVIARWSSAEMAELVRVPPPPAVKCEVLAARPSSDFARPTYVTEAEATAIMSKACAMCHSQVGDLTTPEQGAAAVALLAATVAGTRKLADLIKRHYSGGPAAPAPRASLCGKIIAQLTWARFALGAGATLGGMEFLKLMHTRFLGADGSLDARAIASDEEDLGTIQRFVMGRGEGKEHMPPRAMPRVAVGFYSDSDKRKLATWLQQMMTSDLPRDCQVLRLSNAMPYRDAAEECAKGGMGIPTAGQLPKLVAQLPPEAKEGCVWTSSFSTEKETPRKAWSLESKSLVSVAAGESCSAVCLR